MALSENQSDLPSVESTKSYWHSEPAERLIGYRSSKHLPLTADVVVVGSGITGAFAARELVQGGRSVVMLEAREACWGATGRNGGHCQPFIYATKPHLARFELATYNHLQSLVTANSIPCDWRTVGGVHALPSQEVLDLVAAHLQRLKRDHPDLASEAALVTDPEELSRLRVPGVIGAVVQRNAAKLWPYKLVCWVLEQLLDEGEGEGKFGLYTGTPVEGLQQLGDGSWVLHTPRGQVAAQTVVLATNAYTSRLLPKLTGLLVPVRGQVCALTPPEGATALEHSHVWVSEGGDDYLVQRPTGELILGGERLSVPEKEVGVSWDDGVNPDVGRRLREALSTAVKLKPEGSEEDTALEATYEWTGIMGYSRDGHPWVGQVPESLGGGEGGLWIAAGYTGHGMPVAARCAIAVAEEILGKKGVDVPKEFRVEGGREERARTAVLPTDIAEEVRMMIGDIE